MNEKKRLELQQKLISRQSEQIESLKTKVEKLKLELEEKDRIVNSVSSLKDELAQNIADIKSKKIEYESLVEELRNMKKILNQEVYKGRWNLIRLLIK